MVSLRSEPKFSFDQSVVELTLRQAVHDKLAPAGPVWDLYQKHCNNGAQIEYQQNLVNVSHFEESLVGKSLSILSHNRD
jgi:hypothetical protein